jgi:hypothetical protein
MVPWLNRWKQYRYRVADSAEISCTGFEVSHTVSSSTEATDDRQYQSGVSSLRPSSGPRKYVSDPMLPSDEEPRTSAIDWPGVCYIYGRLKHSQIISSRVQLQVFHNPAKFGVLWYCLALGGHILLHPGHYPSPLSCTMDRRQGWSVTLPAVSSIQPNILRLLIRQWPTGIVRRPIHHHTAPHLAPVGADAIERRQREPGHREHN